jgi:glucosyl-3-phosphoglycerate phosphatase
VGRDQGRRLASFLLTLKPDLVVTSDLRRTVATAGPLASAGVRVVADPDLREVCLGGWEGLDESAVHDRFPSEYLAWCSGQPVRRGGGETTEEAGRRAAPAIDLALRGEPGLVVVISHGLVLQAAMGLLDRTGRICLSRPAPHLANGAYVAFADDGRFWD